MVLSASLGFNMQSDMGVFDAARQVAIQVRALGGVRTIRARSPTDDDCTHRRRRRKLTVQLILKQLGRGILGTTVPSGGDIDAALLAKSARRRNRRVPVPKVQLAFDGQR